MLTTGVLAEILMRYSIVSGARFYQVMRPDQRSQEPAGTARTPSMSLSERLAPGFDRGALRWCCFTSGGSARRCVRRRRRAFSEATYELLTATSHHFNGTDRFGM